MRILILNWKDIKHPQVGGAEIIVYELAKRLVRDGHQVTWFCRRFKGSSPTDSVDGINIVRQGNLVTMYLLAPVYYWTLKTKPDLVIDMSNTIYWQTPLWAWKSKKIAYLNQLAKEVFFYEYSWPLAIFGYLVERFQYLTYLHIPFLCYSQGTSQDLIQVGINPRHIKIFPLGLDLARYAPGTKSATPLFIAVNRLVKMKRTDLIIQAMYLLTNKYPTVKLVIVGTGYERQNLERLRDKLKLQDTVEFTDKDTWFFSKNAKDRKLLLMQQAWALIIPSVKEGWCMTVTECAACGTPTIATAVTGLTDSVLNGKTGILVSANPTPAELADVMEKIIVDKNLRQKLSKQALTYSHMFTWERSYRQFWHAIRVILSER